MKKDLISPAYDAVITSAYKYQNPMRDFIEPFLISPSYLFSNFFVVITLKWILKRRNLMTLSPIKVLNVNQTQFE